MRCAEPMHAASIGTREPAWGNGGLTFSITLRDEAEIIELRPGA